MAKLFSYRNATENGVVRAFAWPEAKADAKVAELNATYSDHFEKVEVEIVMQRRDGWVSGNGRAGNSYKTSWMEKTLREVKK